MPNTVPPEMWGDGPSELPQDICISALLEAQNLTPALQSVVASCPGGWAITSAAANFLGQLVGQLQPKSVLEFGAGSSSVVLATALSLGGGGRLTSLEQSPRWCVDQWALVQQQKTVDAAMIVTKPELGWGCLGLYFWYKSAVQALAARAPFDLVLIDAPQFFFGRDGALPLIYPYLNLNALIVLDDAGRADEKAAVARWLKTYPGLTLVYNDPDFSGKGLAVLKYQTAADPVLSYPSFFSGVKQTLYTLISSQRRYLRAKQARDELSYTDS